MGYQLHITRADSWLDARDAPIDADEWLAAARASPHLAERPGPGGDGDPPTFVLVDGAGHEAPKLTWSEGRVDVRGARAAHLSQLVSVASALGARLVGDDHESYDG